MTPLSRLSPSVRPLVGLMVFQSLTTIFFAVDAVHDLAAGGADWRHMLPEAAAVCCLILGIVFEAIALRWLVAREARLSQGLRVASGALSEIMEAYFQSWLLTPAERDVATFVIKGFSIAEIAELRGSAEGTIKTHLNSIYRKAGVPGRAQLVSLLVEDLMNAPLIEDGVAPGELSPKAPADNRQQVADRLA